MTVALTRPSLEDRALAVFCDDLEAAIRATGDSPTEPLSAVRARCQSSLRAFIEEVWPVVEPQTPFVGNWHIDAICAHLEAVTRGEIRNLLINIPPGCMKSYIVSVMWPAWEWAQSPHTRYLCVSYDQNLSTRDNVRCRRIVESDRYRELFPHVVLAADQNQKTRYDTQQGPAGELLRQGPGRANRRPGRWLEGPSDLDDFGQPSPVPRGRRHGTSGPGLQVPGSAGPAGALVGFGIFLAGFHGVVTEGVCFVRSFLRPRR